MKIDKNLSCINAETLGFREHKMSILDSLVILNIFMMMLISEILEVFNPNKSYDNFIYKALMVWFSSILYNLGQT